MLSALGMSVADLLGWRALADGQEKREVSCILIWLDGGPSHLDMFDPKPDAPKEVRGPFDSIPTAIPGVHINEHLPLTAKAMGDADVLCFQEAANFDPSLAQMVDF